MSKKTVDIKLVTLPTPAAKDDWVNKRVTAEAPQLPTAEEGPRTKRLTADIPFDLHHKVRVHCLANEISISEFVHSVLQREMALLAAGTPEPREIGNATEAAEQDQAFA
ncbi:MAG: hypothetical protein QOF14_3739 [Hyphomicrobiales bacterium]|jgi:hypothetical protein|nr:hypothetical protein [Hyphomicrobiales bacterium]